MKNKLKRIGAWIIALAMLTITLAGAVQGLTAEGGTITNFTNASGTYIVHTYTSSGYFNTTDSGSIQILVIAGGGGGGGNNGGAGGAGGYNYNNSYAVTAQNYTVTVGNGGAGSVGDAIGNIGENSTFDTITSVGGGYGGGYSDDGGNGGSGGGTGGTGTNGGTATAGQGYNGGGSGGSDTGSGGGGASEIGENAPSNSEAGDGGDGISNSINGTAITYAGGGGGGAYDAETPGVGGAGGGGNGATGTTQAGSNGEANTGGGGGGGSGASGSGGAGGSGIVIIAYLHENANTTLTITAQDEYNSTSINSFSVNYTWANGTSGTWHTTTGTINAMNEPRNDSTTINLTYWNATNYYERTYNNVIITASTDNTHSGALHQSEASITAREITTNNIIMSWTLTTPYGDWSTTNGTIEINISYGIHTLNWSTNEWYYNYTGLSITIDEQTEDLPASGFWARNITFQSNLTGSAIQPNCEQDGYNYTSTDYLMHNSTSDITCTLTGYRDRTFTPNATPDNTTYVLDPALLWLIFDQSTTGYVETEDCDEYPANCENFTGTSVYIQQSNLSIGRVSVKFNPEANTSNYQQVFEYDNTNNTHIREYIKIITPDLVQQVKVTGERSPLENARVTALNLGQNPDTNATDWLTVFADFTTVDGFATLLLNDEDTYKLCAQATGYTTKCEIHYIAPASTETILMDLDPTTTTAGHNFIATSCPNYYTEAQNCVLEVNTYQSYSQICIEYTSDALNTTSCSSSSVTKSWNYALSNTTGNITIEVLLDGTSALNITHVWDTYDPTVDIGFDTAEMADGDTLMDKIRDDTTYLIVVYILLTIIGVVMGFMAEKYFNGFGLYGSGVWFLVLALGKLYIFWIPVIVIGVHAIIYKLIPLFQNK